MVFLSGWILIASFFLILPSTSVFHPPANFWGNKNGDGECVLGNGNGQENGRLLLKMRPAWKTRKAQTLFATGYFRNFLIPENPRHSVFSMPHRNGTEKNPLNPPGIQGIFDFFRYFDPHRISQQVHATVIAMAAIPPAIMRIGFVEKITDFILPEFTF